jgi:murein DD-endopeptidase MepM/ murein hydrolase activator NlpD
VHFEVLKNGRQINPASYLGKAEVVKGSGSAVVKGFGVGSAED